MKKKGSAKFRHQSGEMPIDWHFAIVIMNCRSGRPCKSEGHYRNPLGSRRFVVKYIGIYRQVYIYISMPGFSLAGCLDAVIQHWRCTVI